LSSSLFYDLEAVLRKSATRARRGASKLAVSLGELENKPWDDSFRAWIADAKRQGRDPNDVGDERWGNARIGAEQRYLPMIDAGSVVLELGPGTGRYTRHLMPRCKEMVLVDYSKLVCRWLEEYFQGKGQFRVVHASDYSLAAIPDASIDVIIANGVFEHIYLEGFYHYFVTFARLLKPGARGCFNFNNILSEGGFRHFREKLPSGMDQRSIFRFYHPQTVEKLCREAGLEVVQLDTSDQRFAFITFAKPA
ncbi:MAG TPA: class I SAM-dependent methyltransferase, partial [Polyangiaceae bacterium]|nr:class I SAM-dependent methyltransferase [Polyangiaceae bacterium]